ncbi:MAG: cbb3-type cytochrome c oxidase subunit I [Anaerolineae bacterium]|nr:cbb3-type cytochrome c oxidase subunit I [Anaerolineae bacterium]
MTAVTMPQTLGKANFRTCPVTALKVDVAAERLIIANAVAAVVFLAIGGLGALLISLTRWQAIHLLPADWFYRLVTAHGFDMLVAWIVFFEIAGLYFGSTILLNARQVLPKVAWFAFALMAAGAVLTNVIVLMGLADVMFTAYVPLKAHPLFYLGIILFAVGALVAVILFFGNLVTAKREGRYTGSMPLMTYGLMTAAILAVYTLISGALAYVPAFLWSLGLIPEVDPGIYRNLFWSFGHPAQQINLAAMVSVWYALAAMTVGATPLNEKFSRLAFVLYILFINLGSAHHLLTDPGPSFAWKATNTSYAMYLAVLGSLIHAFSIPGAIEVAQRRKGFTRGAFEWLRKGPWREPGFSSLVLSMVLFGWVGGVTGVVIGTEQINMLAHNTLRIPGHFHATVVSGTTLAFMGLTYYLIPLIFRREVKLKKWASWQPYVFGIGMLLVSIGMIGAGLQGAPRRHWDITFTNSPLAASLPGATQITLAIMGVGAVIAIVGGIMYVSVVLISILTGKRTEPSRLTLVMAQANPLVEDAIPNQNKEVHGKLTPRGTIILTFSFLGFLMAYYLFNWWLLGRAWFIR